MLEVQDESLGNPLPDKFDIHSHHGGAGRDTLRSRMTEGLPRVA